VRRSIRDIFAELETGYPYLKQTLLTAMGNLQTSRLLDTRYLDLDAVEEERAASPFPIIEEDDVIES
jgi:hypothetical protein